MIDSRTWRAFASKPLGLYIQAKFRSFLVFSSAVSGVRSRGDGFGTHQSFAISAAAQAMASASRPLDSTTRRMWVLSRMKAT